MVLLLLPSFRIGEKEGGAELVPAEFRDDFLALGGRSEPAHNYRNILSLDPRKLLRIDGYQGYSVQQGLVTLHQYFERQLFFPLTPINWAAG